MKAIILAAGRGTRLKPITENLPKPMIRLSGMALLEIVVRKLLQSGFDEIALNIHHHAEQMRNFVHDLEKKYQRHFLISEEHELLDTGGGIKKVISYLDTTQPILVHNVDIVSDLNLTKLYEYHVAMAAQATLAIQKRSSDRALLFDVNKQLCGRTNRKTGRSEIMRDGMEPVLPSAFCGIQIINPDIFLNFPGEKFYSIDCYLEAASKNYKIMGYDISESYWRDLGTLDDLHSAEQDLAMGKFQLL